MEKLTAPVTSETSVFPVALETIDLPPSRTGARPLAAQLVVSLALEDDEPLYRAGHVPGRQETTRMEFAMPQALACRLEEFYRLHIARRRPGFYDCMSALNYWVGWRNTPIETSVHEMERHYQTSTSFTPTRLRACQPYGIKGADKLEHALLALPGGDTSLSVIDARGPLVVASNEELLRSYGGVGIFGLIWLASSRWELAARLSQESAGR